MWFRSTDGGQGLAMSGWQSSKDTVENKVNFCNVLFAVNVVHLSCQIPAIANFYTTVYGDEEDANVAFVPMQSKGKQDVGKPAGWRVTQVCNPISSRS